jgi:ATP-dependent NAD(P)H-hydrate dehydratase
MLAGYAGCHITRTSSKLAFKKYGRSVLTTDMLSEIGSSYNLLMKH